jgi:YjbE family integral membrane protein
MTLVVVWLLKIPGLMLVGGLGLIWIAYKLLADSGEEEGHDDMKVNGFWGALKTIIIADALMGIDNVLGVAGAAQGSFDLVVLGLLISIPIVVLGSTVVLKIVERFPIVISLGAAVLAFTAGKMIVNEQLLSDIFKAGTSTSSMMYWGLIIIAVIGVLLIGNMKAKKAKASQAH